jgi:very-short-patch-repair endonuclease
MESVRGGNGGRAAPTQPPPNATGKFWLHCIFYVAFGGGARRAVGAGAGYNAVMPVKRSNPKTMHRAGELRKELTPAEKKLWVYLRGDKLNGVNFRRQHAIGNYIVDFVSIKKKLIIELDGSQHLEQAEYDVERSRYLESQGYKVVRFWNNDVLNDINGVIRVIEFALVE